MSVLNAEQASALIEGVRDAEFGVAIPVALYSGLRLSELRGLRWKDADLSTGNLRVVQTVQRLRDGSLVAREPKTDGSRRAVSIPILIRELLRDHRTAQIETRLRSGIPWSEESLVFGDALGNPISETRFRKALKNVLTQAKLPTIRLHDLRHTMATLMLAAGEHPKVVAERLGHSTVNLTLDTYSHVLPGLQEAAAERLASSLAKAKADAKATTDS
jgi:integrase